MFSSHTVLSCSQDSLGGNSETLFIGCVSPCHFQHEHTIGTLRWVLLPSEGAPYQQKQITL